VEFCELLARMSETQRIDLILCCLENPTYVH
jgi:hypothetical protein